MKYLTGLSLVLFMLLALPARSGTILIQGQLGEAGCDFTVKQENLDSTCYRHGQWLRQTQPLARVDKSSVAEQSVQTQLVWLDRQQQRGVIIVSYQ